MTIFPIGNVDNVRSGFIHTPGEHSAYSNCIVNDQTVESYRVSQK